MNLLVLPLLIPFATGLFGLAAWTRPRLQAALGITGAFGLLAAGAAVLTAAIRAGVVTLQLGDWPAPYGITLAADVFSGVMVFLTGLIATVVGVYSLAGIDRARRASGYFPLFHFMLMGLCGVFLTGDLFNLYVWFEVTLIASFVLMSLGTVRRQLAGTLRYLVLNLVASTLLLSGIGLVYGRAGTLNLADLSQRLIGATDPYLGGAAALFLIAFGIKGALFPLYFWLPASYPTPPAALAAIFAGLLTKLGLYALIRVATLVFVLTPSARTLLLPVAAATMIAGASGALAQRDLGRLLSFSVVSQMGYILMGLGLGSTLALAGAIFFIVHEAVAKTALFLIAGIIDRRSGRRDISRLGGLVQTAPVLSVLFLLAGLALAGLPPFSGFVAKYTLVRAALMQGAYWIAAVALVVAILTLLYVLNVWREVFWKPASEGRASVRPARYGLMIAPAGLLAAATLIIGLGARPIFDLALRAGTQLISRSAYVQAVLGGAP